MQFSLMENLKMNRKKTKKNDLPEPGFESQIFSNFPAHDLNFREDDKIKSKQGSKKYTLGCIMFGPFWSVWCKTSLAEVGVSLP